MDIEGTTRCLMSILSEAARPKDPSHFKTGLWGRAQVIVFIYFFVKIYVNRICVYSEY